MQNCFMSPFWFPACKMENKWTDFELKPKQTQLKLDQFNNYIFNLKRKITRLSDGYLMVYLKEQTLVLYHSRDFRVVCAMSL